MWFGDLVTMGWWEGIWLNEAFATFMEVLCVDAFRPAWQRWVGFIPTLEAAMAIDGVHATRPIEYPVGPPKEAEGMFDLLTYEKGCGVLRMLEQHIGADVFRDGVRTYLKAHAYANTVTTDLWDALEAASGEPVRDVANTFILQGGHPLVTLDANVLSQQPFSFGPVPEGTESAIGDLWNVPVAVRALAVDGRPGAPIRNLVLGASPVELPEAEAGLAVVNADGWGIFRVGYGAEHRSTLAAHLADLTPSERAHLVADTWATTLAGHSSLEEFLLLAAKLGPESDPTTWTPVGSALSLCSRVTGAEDRDLLHQAVAALIGPLHARLGFDAQAGEGERTPTLRSLAITLLGTIGADQSVRAEAARRFDASPMGGGTGQPIDADVATATLAALAHLVRPGDYDALLESYRTARTPQEELRALHTLAAFPDLELAQRTFDLSLSEVRTQNGWLVIAGLLGNPVAGQAIWHRMTESWDLMLERFPKNAAARMVEPISGLCGDPAFADNVVRFLHDHPLTSGPRRVLQSIERLGVNVAFGAREGGRMAEAYRAAIAAAQG
jgi:puromycin-sensitive aminopeptidase